MKALITLLALSVSAIAGDPKPYKLDTCIVTGTKLGSMGKPIKQTHGDQEIVFCCKPCVKKFAANPAKYLSKLK
jgi:YHS domain-containing protein